MTESDLAQFRQQLFDMKAALRSDSETSREATMPVELDQASVGRISRIDAIQSQQMALASQRRRQDLMLRIEQALRRLRTGKYGACAGCGEEIGMRRLSADPTTPFCIQCAGKRG